MRFNDLQLIPDSSWDHYDDREHCLRGNFMSFIDNLISSRRLLLVILTFYFVLLTWSFLLLVFFFSAIFYKGKPLSWLLVYLIIIKKGLYSQFISSLEKELHSRSTNKEKPRYETHLNGQKCVIAGDQSESSIVVTGPASSLWRLR